ncbi:MAG: biopolymer transporter ExbD [Planctomycetota bacterium]
MRRLRRIETASRVELTPMIDVVFLLLTFFVFAMVLMVRADVLDVTLPELTSGQAAERVEPITVTLLGDGTLALMGEPIELAGLGEAIGVLRKERGDVPVMLAADAEADAGALIELADRLVGAGITRFSVMGRALTRDPAESGGDPP